VSAAAEETYLMATGPQQAAGWAQVADQGEAPWFELSVAHLANARYGTHFAFHGTHPGAQMDNAMYSTDRAGPAA
jgi:hypothetical protein